jgi:hypothetical protein
MTTFKWFASLVLAATIVPALAAKTPLPRKCRQCTPSWHAGNSFSACNSELFQISDRSPRNRLLPDQVM